MGSEVQLSSEEQFLSHLENEARWFRAREPSSVYVLHHNDADGLSSGAILFAALERYGLPFRGACLEKPYPRVLEYIFNDSWLGVGSIVIFADFASGMLPLISQLDQAGVDVLILDHHSILKMEDPRIHLVNCRSFDVSGNRDCSASTVCYFFALALSEHNRDLSRFAVLGAHGDRHFDAQGKLSGLNARAAEHATEAGLLSLHDEYELDCGLKRPALDLARDIDALGSFGYLCGGPDFAIKGLLDGFDERYVAQAGELRASYESTFEEFAGNLELQQEGSVEWFLLPASFGEMGVKTVGLVCEDLLEKGIASPDKYLAGFQIIPSRVPGVGEFQFHEYKVSMRISPALRARMEQGQMPGLNQVLPAASNEVGGFVDACHMHAAAATVKKGREGELIAALNREIETAVK